MMSLHRSKGMSLLLVGFFFHSIGTIYATSEGLTKASIQSVVTANQDQVKGCYDAALTRDPQLAGKFRVEIKVSKIGKVESTKVKDSNLSTPDLEKCIEQSIRKWTFVAPLASQPTTFSYPFSFSPPQAPAVTKPSNQPLPGAPQTVNDAQTYKGRVFKKSNRAIDDVKIFQSMTGNPLIKGKADNCENTRVMIERCEDLGAKDRIICSAMTDAAPRKPADGDWALVEHPDAFRIVSGVYFLGYWHVACEFIHKM